MSLFSKTTIGAALLFAAAVPSYAYADNYKLDPAHTGVVFKINHLGFSNTYGRFNDVSGKFTFDGKAPEKGSLEVSIKTDSVDTNDAKRDKHLKSPDFFNAAINPTVTYKSTAIKKVSDTEFEVTGNLTLNGITKPQVLKLTKLGEGNDPWGKYRMGFDTTLFIKRSDYNMKFMPEAIGDDVVIMISTEGIKE